MKTKLIFLALIAIAVFQSCGSGSSYQDKVQSIEEIEKADPLTFLSVEGKYGENFWGDKIEIEGTITNLATVASYKDAKVRVNFFTKTKTLLGSEEYTVYEIFKPNSQKNFTLTVKNYENVNSIGLDVVEAIPLN